MAACQDDPLFSGDLIKNRDAEALRAFAGLQERQKNERKSVETNGALISKLIKGWHRISETKTAFRFGYLKELPAPKRQKEGTNKSLARK